MATSAQPSLLIFTSSQSSLPIKTPRPRKPILNLPAIIHRALHSALDVSPPSFLISPSSTIFIPHPDTLIKHDVPSNHSHPPHTVASHPAEINGTSQPEAAGTGHAKGDELEAEITVKVHLVAPGSPEDRAQWVVDALESLKEKKGLTKVDTLLVGFKGIDYKGKRTVAAEFFGCGVEGLTSDVAPVVTEQAAKDAKEVWNLVQNSVDGRGVKQIGTLYLPLEVLQDLSESATPPKVNSLDTPDCHSLPKDYTQFAKEKGIELWAGGGGEGSDADMHNLLNEFVEVLALDDSRSDGQAETNGGIQLGPLSNTIPLREDGLKYDETAKRGVAVRWVLSYTLVSKSRNVLKDKGYIVAADLVA